MSVFIGSAVVLLLDLDGVVNADRPPWPDPDMHAAGDIDGTQRKFRWSQQMLGELVNLYHLDMLEIRWCSTWAPWAEKINIMLDLPAFPGCWDTEPADVSAAKLACAQAVLAQGRRLIWADDEAIPSAKQRRNLGMTGDALYLVPNSFQGLSPGQVSQIRKFVFRPAGDAR